jgi:hypothetical protein
VKEKIKVMALQLIEFNKKLKVERKSKKERFNKKLKFEVKRHKRTSIEFKLCTTQESPQKS